LHAKSEYVSVRDYPFKFEKFTKYGNKDEVGNTFGKEDRAKQPSKVEVVD